MTSKKELKKRNKRQAKTIARLYREKNNPVTIPLNPTDGVTVSSLAVISGTIYHLSFRYKLAKDEVTGKWINAEPAKVCIDGKDAVWSNLCVWDRYMTDEQINSHVEAFHKSMKSEGDINDPGS